MDAGRKQLWEELADALEALLQGRIGLTEGCRQAFSLGNRLELDNTLFGPFRGFEMETRAFPLGDIRELWSARSLEQMDSQRTEAEGVYRDWILGAARKLHAHAKEQGA